MSARLQFTDLHPKPAADMRAEVIAGLSRPYKRLPPKYFYDQRGSQLFDAITKLPEYYPTRTEIDILERHGDEMAELVGRETLLVELGSGSSAKIRVLLQALKPSLYMPIDISREHLLQSAASLARSFGDLEIHAVCADYSSAFELPLDAQGRIPAAFFPGSSIGNFEPDEARWFLRSIGDLLGSGGKLLIGVDLIKDRSILNAAYNDAQGITADFNINLLRRINRELNANFDLEYFRHNAYFNSAENRIEMHLISVMDQRVNLAGRKLFFREGESIHTENSYKYSVAGFQALAREAGFEVNGVWTDEQDFFSVHCLQFSDRSGAIDRKPLS